MLGPMAEAWSDWPKQVAGHFKNFHIFWCAPGSPGPYSVARAK